MIPGSERSPLEEGKAIQLYYSYLENPWARKELNMIEVTDHVRSKGYATITYFRNPKKYFLGEKAIIDRRIEVNKK